MEIISGKVIKVYIPEEKGIDIMDSTKIGFKVRTKNGIEDYILLQDEFNAQIMKGDKIVITKQVIDDHEFTNIEVDENVGIWSGRIVSS